MVGMVDELKLSHELYTKVKNEVRKNILRFIYQRPRNYKELIEYTKLRPGSLYHHLGILDPLITKVEHGLYQITELGIECVENLKLIEKEDEKPSITKEKTSELEIESDDLNVDISSSLIEQSKLELIWLSPITYVNLGLTIILSIYLGNKGIAFAGSAIYSVGGLSTFLIDIIAILFGIAIMYMVEEFFFKYRIYDRMKFIIFIRLISMLPALIIGTALFVLFQAGIVPTPIVFTLIFVLTLSLGTLVGASGIHFLRGLSKEDSLLYSIAPGMVDLLIGFIILISL